MTGHTQKKKQENGEEFVVAVNFGNGYWIMLGTSMSLNIDTIALNTVLGKPSTRILNVQAKPYDLMKMLQLIPLEKSMLLTASEFLVHCRKFSDC